MQTPAAASPKSTDLKEGVIPKASPGQSGDLLTRADFGVHVTGRVDSVSGVDHRQGKTQGGKDYSFFQQTVTLALGGQMVEVVYRADNEPTGVLCPHELDDKVRIKVGSPRVFNGRVSFDAIVG